MARLGAEDLSAGVETALYAPGSGVSAVVKVIFANRTQAQARIRVVRRPGSDPTVTADYLTFDELLQANESRHSEYIDMVYPEELLVQASVAGVTVQADGIER